MKKVTPLPCGCLTCGHTVHRIHTGRYWCPRCGTLKEPHSGQVSQSPWLVARTQCILQILKQLLEDHDVKLDIDQVSAIVDLEAALYRDENPEKVLDFS